MKLIIDIHEKDYQSMKNGHIPFSVLYVIMNGTPLPEHHGRIIDESKINRVYAHKEEVINNNIKAINIEIMGTDAPTIIEADKESEE